MYLEDAISWGFPSSGTDLIKTVLNAHPKIELSGEVPYLPKLVDNGLTHESNFEDKGEVRAFTRLLQDSDP